jgi:DNA repair protein RecO
MALLVRGAKKPKSKFAGLIESGHILDVVYYFKNSRSVQILTEASLIHSVRTTAYHYESGIILFVVLELFMQLVHEGETNAGIFNLLHTFISWLSKGRNISFNLIPYIQIRAAEAVGLNLSSNVQNLVNDQDYFFNIETGQLSHASETNLSFKLSINQAMLIHETINHKSGSVLDKQISIPELKQLIRHLDVYFKYHIDGYQDRKSEKLLKQII